MRPLLVVVLCAWGGLSASVAPAQDQGADRPPTELWKAYPLDETAPASPLDETAPASPPAARKPREPPVAQRPRAESAGDGGGIAPVAVLALALLAAAAGVVAGRMLQARPRARAPAPIAPAAPPAGGTSTPAFVRPRALGYTTVPDVGDAEWIYLRDETRMLEQACRQRGLVLARLVRDVEADSGADLRKPGLNYALEHLGDGEFVCLVVTRLERLTRSTQHLAALMRMLEERRVRLVVVDLDIDTASVGGRVAARALARIGEPTQSVLVATTAELLPDRESLKQRIADMRETGMSLQAIADTLNSEGVPTLRGGARWRPSSVQGAAGYRRPTRPTEPRG